MYKPLPESVTIKSSGINGLGLFADQPIMQGTTLDCAISKLEMRLYARLLGVLSIIPTLRTAQRWSSTPMAPSPSERNGTWSPLKILKKEKR